MGAGTGFLRLFVAAMVIAMVLAVLATAVFAATVFCFLVVVLVLIVLVVLVVLFHNILLIDIKTKTNALEREFILLRLQTANANQRSLVLLCKADKFSKPR